MNAATANLQQSTIRQCTRQLRLQTTGGQYLKLAEEAVKQKHGHVTHLEALLGAEVEERQRNAVARRIQEAKFPKVKTLEDFHFEEAPHLSRWKPVGNANECGSRQRPNWLTNWRAESDHQPAAALRADRHR